MKIDRESVNIAIARACMSLPDLVAETKIPAPTVRGAIGGKGTRPVTIGRIARALNVDVTEILAKEAN